MSTAEQSDQMAGEIGRLPGFREQLRNLLRATANQQSALRNDLLGQIQSSMVPALFLHEVVRQSCLGGGPHSFDIAIDLLSTFDAPLLEVFEGYRSKDRARWLQSPTARHANDDVAYVLLRAL